MKTFIALVTFLLILSGKVAFAPEASKVSPQKHFGTLTTVAVLSEKDIKTPDRQCFKRDSGLIGAIGDTVQLEYGPDETGISNWAILRHNAGELLRLIQ